MSDGAKALLEALLIFGAALSWGLYELFTLRDKRGRSARKGDENEKDGPQPPG